MGEPIAMLTRPSPATLPSWTAGQAPYPVARLGRVRILLVEDDEQQLHLIKTYFDRANEKEEEAVTFIVSCASSAEEAMAAIKSETFDLILLDMLLPDLNGYDLLPALRDRVGSDCAIVMCSVDSQMSLVQLCVRRGADAFLIKPIGFDQIRHIWQFIKELPEAEGSFKRDRMEWRMRAAQSMGERSGSVLRQAQEMERSDVVCTGSHSATTSPAQPPLPPTLDPSAFVLHNRAEEAAAGIPRRQSNESTGSQGSHASQVLMRERLAREARDNEGADGVAADCKQQ